MWDLGKRASDTVLRTSGENSPDASTIVSRSPGKAYARMRRLRRSHFTQSLGTKLTALALLLALLAGTVVSRGVASGGGPVEGGVTALLALAGVATVTVGASVAALLAVCAYRLSREPLTERRALAVLTVEDAASYLGLATGGILVAATVALGAVDPNAGSVVTAPGVAPTPASIAVVAAVGAAVALGASRYVDERLPDDRHE